MERAGLVKEDIVLYPSVSAEFLGVALMHHITPIKEKFKPHGRVKDAAACNANFGPFAIAGVDACTIHANPDKINDIGNNNNNIIHVRGIHPNQPPAQNLIVMPDSSGNDHNNNKGVKLDNGDSNNNDDDDNNNKQNNINQAHAVRFDALPSQKDNKTEDEGVHRSRRKNRGVTDKYANYTLQMAARCKKRSSKRPVIIRNGVFFFLDNGLSNAKPTPEKDRYEYALGVALVTYLIGARIKSSMNEEKQE